MQYPIEEAYPARYRDARGEETTVLHNDGTELRMRLRGVDFVGVCLDDFEPVEGTDPAALSAFVLNRGQDFAYLCDCEIDYEMPIRLDVSGEETQAVMATLNVKIVLSFPSRNGNVVMSLMLELEYKGKRYYSNSEGHLIEYQWKGLQAALPEGIYMKACFSCAYSDYSPFGVSNFGDMSCYRAHKSEYLKVRSKWDLFKIYGTERVQETYYCPEFARRIPGTGYRG